jgi:hypothetical protein
LIAVPGTRLLPSDKLPDASSTEALNEYIEMMLHFMREARPAAGISGGLCVAHHRLRALTSCLSTWARGSEHAIRWPSG